ncbi:substrate-binding domain-containing protein [Sinorhizobium sp. 8-89]|uniref:substrate-binding domain-containing protein n=1 Tax=Sinorhizobium sp. 7-81 TaxID=3049087 RepID=UPI0024C46552|nr:substrate-binding domain-containing protein [Sinorhizobium sp. 7-81]MDK1386512.1 substrate-binding domain-containing protein [Sinorhizobium sp. 7-81]
MNTNRRQFLKLTAALTTAAALAGSARGAFAADKIKVGFSQGTMNHPWRIAMVEVNKKFAAENYPEIELIVTDGNNDASKQVADVESLVAQGINVLVISPLTAQALTPVVKDAMANGIPVLTLDRKVNTEVTCHMGGANLPLGEGAAKFLINALPDGAKIIELQGTAGASATLDRHKGFADVIASNSKYEVIADQNCDYTREKAVKFMEDMVQRFKAGEIQAVYAHNDEMALGAVQVLEAAGRLDGVKVIGMDGQNNAFDAIKAGKMSACFIYPYCAPEGIQAAYKIAKGEAIEKEIVLPTVEVTAANVDQYVGKGI